MLLFFNNITKYHLPIISVKNGKDNCSKTMLTSKKFKYDYVCLLSSR